MYGYLRPRGSILRSKLLNSRFLPINFGGKKLVTFFGNGASVNCLNETLIRTSYFGMFLALVYACAYRWTI